MFSKQGELDLARVLKALIDAGDIEPRPGYRGGQLVDHGPRVGFTKAGVVKKGGNPYMEDEAFVKWAKKNYPDLFSTRTLKEGRIEIADVATEYERMLAKKDKTIGTKGLMEALGENNPYSKDMIDRAFSQVGFKKITKDMPANQKSRIRQSNRLRKIIVDAIGEPKLLAESMKDYFYLGRQLESKGLLGSGATSGKTKYWDLTKRQINALNKALNKNYRIMGLQENTLDNIYNLFDDKKFMNAVKAYKGGEVDTASYLFKNVFKPGVSGGNAYAYMMLGRALRGEIKLDGIEKDKALGNKIIQSMTRDSSVGKYGEMEKAALRWSKFQMAKHFDDPTATYDALTKTMSKAFRDAGIKGRLGYTLVTDEVFPARTGQLAIAKGSQAYNQFVQFIDKRINERAKTSFDGNASTRYQEIIKARKKGNWSRVNELVGKHEDAIKNFYNSNPEAKGKVKLTQLHYNPKTHEFLTPEKLFETQYGKGTYETIPGKIKRGMEKFHAKTGLSLDPGGVRTLEKSAADVKTLTRGKEWRSAIQSSKAKMLAKTLELAGVKICSDQSVASGGRIGFAKPVCGMKFVEQNEDAFMRKAGRNDEAAKLFRSGDLAKYFKGAKSWAAANMGPLGWIGGELLIVGLGTAWDMSKGKGWKEAMDNWTGLGGHFGQAEKRLKQIGIEQGYSEEQINDAMKIGQLMDLSTEAEEKQWELGQIQEQQDIGGTARYKTDPKRRFARPRGYLRGEYQDPKFVRDLKTEVPKMWEEGTEIFESLKDYESSTELYAEMQERKKREEYDKMMKLRSMPMNLAYGQQFPVSGEPEYKPWTLSFARGGLANLTRTVAPDSGPVSQGLRSLYIDDMD